MKTKKKITIQTFVFHTKKKNKIFSKSFVEKKQKFTSPLCNIREKTQVKPVLRSYLFSQLRTKTKLLRMLSRWYLNKLRNHVQSWVSIVVMRMKITKE